MEKEKIAAIGAGVILIAVGIFALMYRDDAPADNELVTPASNQAQPTNFAAVGTVEFEGETAHGGIPHFVYTENGVEKKKELKLDEMSYCSFGNGAVICMAMSVTLDRPLGGREAVVEGIENDTSILIRKIRVLDDGEEPRFPEPGDVFISWMKAVELIETCKAEMVMQTHALDVYITLKDGSRVRAVEPMIDDVFKITNRAMNTCGAFPVATE